MEEFPGRNIFEEAQFIHEHEFAVVSGRPTRAIDGFASMVVYDLDPDCNGVSTHLVVSK